MAVFHSRKDKPAKITLAEARAQGDFMVQFWCENARVHCHHKGEIRLSEAIDRWGAETRLDQVPARCTKCGSAEFVDVRARPPRREGGQGAGRIVEG